MFLVKLVIPDGLAESLDLCSVSTSPGALDSSKVNLPLELDSSDAFACLSSGDWCAADLSQPSRSARLRLDPGVSSLFDVDGLDVEIGFAEDEDLPDIDKTFSEVDKSRAAAATSPLELTRASRMTSVSVVRVGGRRLVTRASNVSVSIQVSLKIKFRQD